MSSDHFTLLSCKGFPILPSYTSRAGRKFQNARRVTNQCDAQTEVFVCTSLRPFRLVVAFWWWLVVFPWSVGGGDVLWLWCDEVW